MSPDPSKLPAMPKERDYADTAVGAREYARDMAEWLRMYVDLTDDHRKGNVGTIGIMVAQHESDLQPPSSMRPGWVARELANLAAELVRQQQQQAEDNTAVMEEARRVRGYLKAAIVTSASALISLASFLAGQLIMAGNAGTGGS